MPDLSFFFDHTLLIVAAGSCILGITAGCLGSFAVLRQQSLLGDAIAHATLPGVGIAFLLTQDKSPLGLLIGAAIAGWVGTLFVKLITQTTAIKKDAALGLVLSVFFGFGLVLITIIQKLPTATKAGIDKFLFGSAATLLQEEVYLMSVLGGIVLLLTILFWKEFKIFIFDADFAKSIGLPVQALDVFLTSLIVISIVIGLQTVGVVLMSAMLVAPAAAARQWTDRLSGMILLASAFGAVSGAAGAVTSSLVPHLPTGPTIVIYLSLIVLFSLLFAPNRGLLWDWLRAQRHKREIQTTTMLKNLLLFSEIQTDPFHPHDIAALEAIGRAAIQRTMNDLEKKGWARQYPDKRWALTPIGLEKAKLLTDAYEEQVFH
ncbi:MAG: metal ABC transporter permease [Candidatus Omnitrophota bacterium]|nr:metal ABC transporter permease [Candidatus Omnitrophota bacterium]MDZ4241978.1 metal ABC transporter permease [Candidatus Omnitrophota bacterium]